MTTSPVIMAVAPPAIMTTELLVERPSSTSGIALRMEVARMVVLRSNRSRNR
ncbi:hypothetical protein D3C72_2034510 [compost metagenome]